MPRGTSPPQICRCSAMLSQRFNVSNSVTAKRGAISNPHILGPSFVEPDEHVWQLGDSDQPRQPLQTYASSRWASTHIGKTRPPLATCCMTVWLSSNPTTSFDSTAIRRLDIHTNPFVTAGIRWLAALAALLHAFIYRLAADVGLSRLADEGCRPDWSPSPAHSHSACRVPHARASEDTARRLQANTTPCPSMGPVFRHFGQSPPSPQQA